MSVRENIELYGLSAQEESAKTWIEEVGATEHPRQEDAYMLDGLPFHAPRPAGDHISILSFNNTPLPDALVEGLGITVNSSPPAGLKLGMENGRKRRSNGVDLRAGSSISRSETPCSR